MTLILFLFRVLKLETKLINYLLQDFKFSEDSSDVPINEVHDDKIFEKQEIIKRLENDILAREDEMGNLRNIIQNLRYKISG